MFVSLLILTTLLACGLGYLYSQNSRISQKTCKKYIIAGWVLIYITTMLMCNYLAVVGIPFSELATGVNFIDTINSGYVSDYIQMTIIIAIVIGVYWFLRRFIPAYWFIIFIGLFSLVAYYPGIPYNDTNDLYRFYLHHSYTDWQPALYSIWWNIFGFYGSAFLANNISYYLGLGYISYRLDKQKKNWQNNLLVLFSCNPIFFTQLNYVFKGTLFAGLLIDATAIYMLLMHTKNFGVRLILYCAYFIVLFLVVGTRYNGITSIIPFLALIIWSLLSQVQWSKIKKLSVATGAVLIITFVFAQANIFIMYNIFKASKDYTLSLVMQNDLANIECRTNHKVKIPDQLFADANNIDELRQQMCSPILLNEFDYDALFNANWGGQGTSKTLLGNDGKMVFDITKQAWLPTVLHHPFIYMYYRLRFTLNDFMAQYYWPPYVLAQGTQWPEGVDKPDTFSPLKLNTQLILAKISQAQHSDMRYVMGLFIIIGMLATLFYLIINANYSLAFIVVLSNLLTFLGLYLVTGVHAARYYLWNDIATMLGIVLIESKNKITSHFISGKN